MSIGEGELLAMTDCLGDIYDGEVWRTLHSDDMGNFLSTPHSYLLSMNIDWFQPFVHGATHSVGAVY